MLINSSKSILTYLSYLSEFPEPLQISKIVDFKNELFEVEEALFLRELCDENGQATLSEKIITLPDDLIEILAKHSRQESLIIKGLHRKTDQLVSFIENTALSYLQGVEGSSSLENSNASNNTLIFLELNEDRFACFADLKKILEKFTGLVAFNFETEHLKTSKNENPSAEIIIERTQEIKGILEERQRQAKQFLEACQNGDLATVRKYLDEKLGSPYVTESHFMPLELLGIDTFYLNDSTSRLPTYTGLHLATIHGQKDVIELLKTHPHAQFEHLSRRLVNGKTALELEEDLLQTENFPAMGFSRS